LGIENNQTVKEAGSSITRSKSMEMIPQIQAYFEAKSGKVNMIDDCFADDICIEDTGENETVKGFENCKKWLENKSRQYKMETKIEQTAFENGMIKVSVSVTGNFAAGVYPFDYFFTITHDKIKSVKIVYTGK
jgi:hypothetical protein